MGAKSSAYRAGTGTSGSLVREAAQFATDLLADDDLSSQLELMISCYGLVRSADYCVIVFERDALE